MDALLQLSATRLAHLIRTREVTAREVVEAHIAHARRTHPGLNALVAERFESARAEADAADSQVREAPPESLPPLLGVPCSIKEAFAVRGMPHTGGLVKRKGTLAAEDAEAVKRLRAAGAIPLGVTNLSELGMWMESNNRVYGLTRNAYDGERIAGGSSGGEGAMVGAGAAPFGLGSDIGGSIRMPAFFNGVFGLKPTGGLVPVEGQYPLPENEALRYLAVGPLARRAEDLMPLLRVLATGVDGAPPAFALGEPAQVRLEALSVLDVEDNGSLPVSQELREAQHRCAAHLARRGARVRKVSLASLRHSLEIWSAMMAVAARTPFSALLGQGEPVRLGRELGRWLLRRSPHTLPSLALVGLERVQGLARERMERFVALGRELRAEVEQLLGPDGVMLYPPYPRTAPPHYQPLLAPFSWVYTAVFNTLEVPVVQVPLGLGAEGLPLGVQVAALHGREHVAVAVALELERAFGGWVLPRRFS
jgi:fatty acid amide hydrolase 2